MAACKAYLPQNLTDGGYLIVALLKILKNLSDAGFRAEKSSASY